MLGIIDEGFEQVEQRAMLRKVIANLPEAEREILLLRFIANKTQTEIAAIVGAAAARLRDTCAVLPWSALPGR